MKMLVVDDSTFIRKSICRIVSQKEPEWEIDMAANGKEALSMVEQKHYDVATIDYNMPDMDGGFVISAIKKKSPDTKIALLTANRQNTTQEKAEQLGVNFIVKPDFTDALLDFIAAV